MGTVARQRLGGFHFRRQQVIEGFIVDFYCHRARLIIEVDGEIHEGLRDRDRERDRILTDKGLRIMRVTNREVETNLTDVLHRILNACLEVYDSYGATGLLLPAREE